MWQVPAPTILLSPGDTRLPTFVTSRVLEEQPGARGWIRWRWDGTQRRAGRAQEGVIGTVVLQSSYPLNIFMARSTLDQ